MLIEDVEYTLVEDVHILNSCLQQTKTSQKDISRITRQGRATFGHYSHLLNAMRTQICLKRKIINRVILKAKTYGSES